MNRYLWSNHCILLREITSFAFSCYLARIFFAGHTISLLHYYFNFILPIKHQFTIQIDVLLKHADFTVYYLYV